MQYRSLAESLDASGITASPVTTSEMSPDLVV